MIQKKRVYLVFLFSVFSCTKIEQAPKQYKVQNEDIQRYAGSLAVPYTNFKVDIVPSSTIPQSSLNGGIKRGTVNTPQNKVYFQDNIECNIGQDVEFSISAKGQTSEGAEYYFIEFKNENSIPTSCYAVKDPNSVTLGGWIATEQVNVSPESQAKKIPVAEVSPDGAKKNPNPEGIPEDNNKTANEENIPGGNPENEKPTEETAPTSGDTCLFAQQRDPQDPFGNTVLVDGLTKEQRLREGHTSSSYGIHSETWNSSDHYVQFVGKGSKWRITIEQIDGEEKGTVDLDSSKIIMDNEPDIYQVDYKDVITKGNFGSGSDHKVTVSALNSQSQPVGQGCTYTIERKSPIVLKFDSHKSINTIDLKNSNVSFDLNGDGTKEKTGWVSDKLAFLVLDINQNGLIDSGRELFGNHSGWGKRSYKNGYLALAHFDTNKDGYIDRKDLVYYNLRLWFDKNGNGISEGHELKNLPEMEVVRIATQSTEFEKRQKAGKNFIPLSGKFWGPKLCAKTGCNTFDVFFLTEEFQKIQARKK